MASTNFEPIYARRVFPCFDEPKYKAIFDLSINHHEKFSAISNGNVKSISEPDSKGRVITSFESTPKMSTYNLAFVVSDFVKITDKQNNISLYARKNAIQDGAYAMDVEDEIMKKLKQYIGTPLGLGKMDLVAIPEVYFGDFPTTTENWGILILK